MARWWTQFMGIQQVKMCYICREEERYDGVWPKCLPQSVGLTACSSHTGENQLDTPVSMYPHRSWYATVFLLAFDRRPETSYF